MKGTIHNQFLTRAGEAARSLSSRGAANPRTAVVLGSGLAGAITVPSPGLIARFDEIPGFPKTSVSGHPGRMIFGKLLGSEILVVEGRFHLYEERGLESAMLMASFLKEMRVEDLVLTTAAGALAPHLKVGDFVVIRGHLVYPLGGRAPGMGRILSDTGLVGGGEIYAPEIAAGLESACLDAGVRFQRGMLAFSEGPCYETAAEARLLRRAGADVVSMSAAADAVAAHCLGLRVGCLCCVTNRVGMWRGAHADHGDVLRASGLARSRVGAAVKEYLSSAVREG